MKRGAGPASVFVVWSVMVAVSSLGPRHVAGADANELINQGVALRRQGDDLGALQRFQQAAQIDKGPRVLAQMGLAEQALGRWVSASEHLNQALGAKADPWIVKNRAPIIEALNLVNDHVGKIEILGGSPRAEVRIDGVLRGSLPPTGPLALTLTMSIGTVAIDLSAPGFVPQQRATTVRARQTTRESFDPLATVPARDRAQAATVATVPPLNGIESPPVVPDRSGDMVPPAASEPPQVPRARAPADAANSEPSSLRSKMKWVAWGLGGAAAGLGIFGLVKQNAAADSFNGGCAVDAMGTIQPLPGSAATVEACRGWRSRIDSNFRLEMIGFVGAAVFAGAGLVLWLTEPRSDRTNAVAWVCVPGLAVENALWMGCNVRF